MLYSPDEELGTVHGLKVGLWYWLSLLPFVLAMLSKGSVAVLPLALMLLVWWQRGRICDSICFARPVLVHCRIVDRREHVVPGSIDAVVVRVEPLPSDWPERCSVVWFYLSKVPVPVQLLFVYPRWRSRLGHLLWWLPLAAALVVTALLAPIQLARSNWRRSVLFAWSSSALRLFRCWDSPTSALCNSLVADHYPYIALIGVTAAVAAAWSAFRCHRARKSVARDGDRCGHCCRRLADAINVPTMFALHQSRVLYQATLRDNPNCWLAYNNIGLALAKTHPPQDVIEYYQQAVRRNRHIPTGKIILGRPCSTSAEPG